MEVLLFFSRGDEKVLTEERHKYILDALAKENILKLQDLVELTGSSESTIRRDLSTLEQGGFLVRVHGGAKRSYEVSAEDRMDEKTSKNVHDKQRIAAKAARMISDGDVIFLDAGSTTYEMIPLLKGRNITVVTNGVPHASLLTDMQVETILIGGKIKMETKAVIGPTSQMQMQSYRFSKAFLGINGIDKQFGFTTPDAEEAAIKRIAIENSAQSFVVADASKFKKVSFIKVCDIEDCSIISYNVSTEIKKNLEDSTNIWEGE
jgi:DeoR family transcriptional regulator, fructose operon transcriptional repressor